MTFRDYNEIVNGNANHRKIHSIPKSVIRIADERFAFLALLIRFREAASLIRTPESCAVLAKSVFAHVIWLLFGLRITGFNLHGYS